MKCCIRNQKGNAILISLGITSFIFVVVSGATSIIDSSLRNSPKVVNANKAFYAAEGAIESALYEAAGRGAGYSSSGSQATLDMSNVNKTKASWNTGSRGELGRARTEGNSNDHTLFIPPRKESSPHSTPHPSALVSLEKNWKKVQFGQSYSFDLYVDDSQRTKMVKMGEVATEGSLTKSCGAYSASYCPNTDGTKPTIYGAPCDGIFFDDILNNLSCTGTDSPVSGICPGGIQKRRYSSITCSVSIPSTDITGEQCLGSGEIKGPHGICSTETKSMFGNTTDTKNDDIKGIFIDVYVPGLYPTVTEVVTPNNAEKAVLNSPVLLWSMQALTDTEDSVFNSTAGDVPDVLEIRSLAKCKDLPLSLNAGTACIKHFKQISADEDGTVLNGYDPENPTGLTYFSDATNYGTWIRIENPTGIFKGKNRRIPISMMNYAQKNILFQEGGETIETLQDFPLYFPRLNIQMGKKREWVTKNQINNERQDKTLSTAYIRVGFRYDDTVNMTDIMNRFPIPGDKTIIEALGYANGYQQKIRVEIEPKELAPMFEYAVFQP